MSKRSDELLVASLANNWVTPSNPAAGTTCVANVGAVHTAKNSNYKHMITSLTYSLINNTAASKTFTLSVRDASIAGSVLSQWDFVVAAGAGVQNAFPGVNIVGNKGNDIFIEFGTPSSSATQKVAAAGWTDEMVNG